MRTHRQYPEALHSPRQQLPGDRLAGPGIMSPPVPQGPLGCGGSLGSGPQLFAPESLVLAALAMLVVSSRGCLLVWGRRGRG